MFTIELPDALYPVFTGTARYRGAYGGRGSAKSRSFATMALLRTYEKPRRILCAREFQNSIKESVLQLLSDQIERTGLPGFDIGESFIRHENGSEFIFKGLKTNIKAIKSLEGVDIVWVEEAQTVSKESWDILIPTIRNPGSEIWLTFNPENEDDETSKRFVESQPSDSRIVKVNYYDNPWFPPELEKERLDCQRTDADDYAHVWLGEYKKQTRGGKVVHAWSFANIDETISYDPNKRLFLTCDFNVDPMCWGIAHIVLINGERHYHFFDEIVLENTNLITAATEFARRYKKHKAGIIVTGDANSGGARNDMSPQVNQVRWGLLKQTLSDNGVENFTSESNRRNPPIDIRVERFNWLVCNTEGKRRVKVHPNCKQIIKICNKAEFVPGTSVMWQPSHSDIKNDSQKKFLRDDMLDAISYLTWQYDPKQEQPKHGQGPKMTGVAFRA
jgi:Phage terminase large subunit